MQAIEALQQMFISNLLPNRKLAYFGDQNLGGLGTGKDRKKRLLFYYMEDAVKKKYALFFTSRHEIIMRQLLHIAQACVCWPVFIIYVQLLFISMILTSLYQQVCLQIFRVCKVASRGIQGPAAIYQTEGYEGCLQPFEGEA